MNRDTYRMSVCRPGFGGDEGSYTTLGIAAAADIIMAVPAGVYDAVYLIKVCPTALGAENLVRISAYGMATVNSQHQSSSEMRVAYGPLSAFDGTISYWRDCGAGIVIEWSRIS